VRVEVFGRLAAGEREKGLAAHEAFGAVGHERHDVMPRLHEQADELARLVGGDSSGHSDQHGGHGHIVPVTLRRG
jgi:hypothetical protein